MFQRTELAVLSVTILIALSCSYDVRAETQLSPTDSGTPDLETFATYDDMRRYFANRNFRSLRYLDNPTGDTYIEAFNKHNEQLLSAAEEELGKRPKRSADNVRKREERKLPTEPKLVKFEISDAVEPSDDVKEIIRQHRSRDLSNAKTTQNQKPHMSEITITSTTSKPNDDTTTRTARKLKSATRGRTGSRVKRALPREPTNFKPKMIPFSVEDAREPDEATKQHIKRMRSLELANLKASGPSNTRATQSSQFEQRSQNRQQRMAQFSFFRQAHRQRRSAPEMVKFELSDAKTPDASMLNLLKQQNQQQNQEQNQQQQSARTSKSLEPKLELLTMERNGTASNETTRMENNSTASPAPNSDTDTASTDNDDTDQSSHESKRYFVYKEAPMKTKKSLNSLPQEVQKVITHLIKENHNGKAYVKYMPAHQLGDNLKTYYSSKLPYPMYGTKLSAPTHVKYVPMVQKVNVTPLHVQQVPLTEKVRYVYTPVAYSQPVYQVAHQAQQQNIADTQDLSPPAITQPIYVTEAPKQVRPVEVHHTYAADLTHIHETPSDAIKELPAPQFKPSKPDPILDENKLSESSGSLYDSYNYGVYAPKPAPLSYTSTFAKPHLHLLTQEHPEIHKIASVTPQAPVIKIEYHAPANTLKTNYKELEEFKELSTLMGKSPEDQIHGLTYLLAKEMQTKLHSQRQQKQLYSAESLKRPQDNTSPILFHPEADNAQPLPRRPLNDNHNSLGVQPGRLIGMAKAKEYIPIVEQGGVNEQKTAEPVATETMSQHSETFIYAPKHSTSIEQEIGLSPNYEGLATPAPSLDEHKVTIENIIEHQQSHSHETHHHPAIVHHTLTGLGGHASPMHESSADKKLVSGIAYNIDHADNSHVLQYASKYAFGYRIRDFHTGNDYGHKQNRDLDGVTRGQYHILLPDGRIQNVIYHADDTGFHADVSFASSDGISDGAKTSSASGQQLHHNQHNHNHHHHHHQHHHN